MGRPFEKTRCNNEAKFGLSDISMFFSKFFPWIDNQQEFHQGGERVSQQLK